MCEAGFVIEINQRGKREYEGGDLEEAGEARWEEKGALNGILGGEGCEGLDEGEVNGGLDGCREGGREGGREIVAYLDAG